MRHAILNKYVKSLVVLGMVLAAGLAATGALATPKTIGTPQIDPFGTSYALPQTAAPTLTATPTTCPGLGSAGGFGFKMWSGGVWSGGVSDASFMHVYDMTHIELAANTMTVNQNTGLGVFVRTITVTAVSNADGTVVTGQAPITLVIHDTTPVNGVFQASGFLDVALDGGKNANHLVGMSLLAHIDFTTDESFNTITVSIGSNGSTSDFAHFGVEWNRQTC